MPDGQGLSFGAEQDLLMSNQAAQPYAVHSYAVHLCATSSGQLLLGGIGRGREGCCGTRGGNSPRRRGGGSRWSVGLVGMMQLDDFRALVESGCLLGKTHHEHRTYGEVGRDQHADTIMLREQAAQQIEALGRKARGADNGRNAVVDAPGEVVHDRIRMGEIDNDLGSFDGYTIVAEVDSRDELQ